MHGLRRCPLRLLTRLTTCGIYNDNVLLRSTARKKDLSERCDCFLQDGSSAVRYDEIRWRNLDAVFQALPTTTTAAAAAAAAGNNRDDDDDKDDLDTVGLVVSFAYM